MLKLTNPLVIVNSLKGTGVNPEHLDAGIIARVVFNLENGLNQM